MTAHPALVEHSAQFPKCVLSLADGLWGFIGFAASNVYAIEGADSVAIVDTTESTTAAANFLTALRERTAKPITTILYTHSHRDHISGASVFADDSGVDGGIDIVASHAFASDLVGKPTGPAKALVERAREQFAFGSSFPDERVNLGCGPGDRPVAGLGAGYLPPTRLIDEARSTVALAGREVELIHAHGERPDHLLVWLPDIKALIAGDNFYHSFPNLYPIRGSAYRDFDAWAGSLDQMLALAPDILAPGHTLPVSGAAAIADRLADYRNAIRYVIETTAAGLNEGRATQDIANTIQLPEPLAGKPWLQEFYGKVSWSSLAYASGTLGWFDGNPTNLVRLSPQAEAQQVIDLAGGADNVQRAVETTDNPQWAMELADRLLVINTHTAGATRIKTTAMRTLADREVNATVRNHYLVSASDMERTA